MGSRAGIINNYEQIAGASKSKGVHANQNADAYGIDQSDYSKIERGKHWMLFEQCKRIALALDTSMDYLAELTDDPKPYPRSK